MWPKNYNYYSTITSSVRQILLSVGNNELRKDPLTHHWNHLKQKRKGRRALKTVLETYSFRGKDKQYQHVKQQSWRIFLRELRTNTKADSRISGNTFRVSCPINKTILSQFHILCEPGVFFCVIVWLDILRQGKVLEKLFLLPLGL